MLKQIYEHNHEFKGAQTKEKNKTATIKLIAPNLHKMNREENVFIAFPFPIYIYIYNILYILYITHSVVYT